MSIETVNSFEELEQLVSDQLHAYAGYRAIRLKVRAWPINPIFPAVNGAPVAGVLDVKVVPSGWSNSPGSGGLGVSVRVGDTWVTLHYSEGRLTKERVREALVELFTENGYKVNP